MMLARNPAISSSFTNCAVDRIRGVCIGQGRGRGDVIVVTAAAFPLREVDMAADLHCWHLSAMGMLFQSVSSSPPLTSSANIGGGGNE